MASAPQHCVSCAEVPLAAAQRAGSLLPVQPHGHHSGLCTERGAPRCREDEEVSPQTGDCRTVSAVFRSSRAIRRQAVFLPPWGPKSLTGVPFLQLERAEVRLEGIDTMLKLASKSFLLPSVQYAMLCGWQRVIPEGTNIG